MNLYEQKRTKRTIIDLVNFITLKYEMIFGYEKSINNLYYYILGYISSKLDESISEKIDERFHYDFNKWLCDKYSDKIEGGMPWSQVYNSLFINEDEKLSAFYSDFSDFIKENMLD